MLSARVPDADEQHRQPVTGDGDEGLRPGQHADHDPDDGLRGDAQRPRHPPRGEPEQRQRGGADEPGEQGGRGHRERVEAGGARRR